MSGRSKTHTLKGGTSPYSFVWEYHPLPGEYIRYSYYFREIVFTAVEREACPQIPRRCAVKIQISGESLNTYGSLVFLRLPCSPRTTPNLCS